MRCMFKSRDPRRLLCWLCCVPLAAALGGCGGDEAPQEPVANDLGQPFVTDQEGGVLILHGANMSNAAKSTPYLPDYSEQEVTRLSSDWGFNFARFLLSWSGVEPKAGEYDMAYLDRVEQALDAYHAAGIHVLLDMHQDVFSEFICGNGAPEWAVRTDGEAVECPSKWFLGYLQPGVQRAFDNFWSTSGPHADVQAHYVEMWAAVVKRLKDHPAVIGYDIMNEPHPGSDFDALEALGVDSPNGPSPGFDRDKLQPFYQRVINRIREEDENHWIAFEPRYGAPSTGLASYFTGLDDPRSGPPRLLYAPHLYSIQLENSGVFDPEADHTVKNWEQHRQAENQLLGTALVAGEWGLDPASEKAELFFRQVLEASDRLMAGWAYWDYRDGGWSWLNADGSERAIAGELVRTYPQRIAGVPKSYSYNAETRVFTLVYADDPSVSGTTQIYVPAARHYPAGWELQVSDADGTWSSEWDSVREVLSLTTPASSGEHTVTIQPTLK